jgi:hypothetical protein
MVNKLWTAKEIEVLQNDYLKLTKSGILKLLPDRTWISIKAKAERLNIKRLGKVRLKDFNKINTVDDIVEIFFEDKVIKCLIDLEDLPKIKKLGHLFAHYSKDIDNYYFNIKKELMAN